MKGPRSLVGASMSARKRWARIEARGYGELIDSPRLRRWVLNLWHLGNGSTNPRKLNRMAKFAPSLARSPEYASGEKYAEIRAQARIGERLRPCRRCIGWDIGPGGTT